MNHVRPFRFGVQARSAPDRKAWLDLGRRAEGAGYAALTMPEHPNDQFSAMAGLTAIAGVTTDLRLGQLVLTNDFKHPALLAKEFATLDLLSDGRLEMGLGAGHVGEEYAQLGIPFERKGTRVDRLFEAVEIVRGLMADEPLTFCGNHYQIEGLQGYPKPIQTPPPLLLGGGGRRILTFAARHADIIGVNGTTGLGSTSPDWTQRDNAAPPGGVELIKTMTAQAVDEKLDLIRAAAGHRLPDIELNIRTYMTAVADDVESATETLTQRLHLPDGFLAASPFALIGPPTKLTEDLLQRRERWGFSYIIVGADDLDAFAPVVASLT
jgi:probable F420-dependent oxidoreductase